MPLDDLLEHLYHALRSPRGVSIISDNPEKTRAKLYVVRKQACDPALNALSVTLSPTNPKAVWIVKR